MILFFAIILGPLSSQFIYAGAQPGCSDLAEKYCKKLYSPKYQGNLGDIHLGLTDNDFKYPVWRRYQLEQLSKNRLPQDFRSELDTLHYFNDLDKFLNSKPIKDSTLAQHKADDAIGGIINANWNQAIDSTVLTRMERLHPGYKNLRRREMPPAWALEAKNMLRDLTAEINRIVWENSDEWQGITGQFLKIRAEMHGLIDESKSLSDSTKKLWHERLNRVQLTPPGTQEPHVFDKCSTSTINAFNNLNLFKIQICAGLLAGMNPSWTLAHEMAHSLGTGPEMDHLRNDSKVGRYLYELKTTVCKGKTPDCGAWNSHKTDLQSQLNQIPNYEANPKEFFSCFQNKKLDSAPGDYYARLGKQWSNDSIEDAVYNNTFLNLTHSKIQTPDGKWHENPAYLNPCNLPEWRLAVDEFPFNLETPATLYFLTEYECSTAGTSEDRLKNAITVAQNLHKMVARRYGEIEGPFTSMRRINSDGYAQDIDEKIADAIGSEAYARILKKIPFLEARRENFYSILADQCEPPDLASQFPKEGAVQNQFSFDAHSKGMKRIQELLRGSIRSAIACSKDFELNECELK